LGIALVVISFSELQKIMLTLKKAHLIYFILAITDHGLNRHSNKFYQRGSIYRTLHTAGEQPA
jgi:hypothetical protein